MDTNKTKEAFRTSQHPIDLKVKTMMSETWVLSKLVEFEPAFDSNLHHPEFRQKRKVEEGDTKSIEGEDAKSAEE